MILDRIPDEDRIWDLCIVGTGPLGLALALESESLGRTVLMLESGQSKPSSELAEASRAEIADEKRHAPMKLAVCRSFGGTSWTWGGRCVAFDDIDFADRPHIPFSAWPLGHDEIRPWYSRAAEYLLCGSDTFFSPTPLNAGPDVSIESLERWSIQPRLARAHRTHIENSKNILVCLNSTVTDLKFTADGAAVARVLAMSLASPVTVSARQIVLAAGGVETTRLLLSVQQKWPGHFGGVDGPLGRYYMGHISGKIASIRFARPDDVRSLDFQIGSGGAWVRRRFVLTPEAQQTNGLLNTAFWHDNPPFHDPDHRSGVLSGVFLALAIPSIGRKLLPEPIRLVHIGPPPHRLAEHLRNVITGAVAGAADIVGILNDRFLRRPRKPGFIVRNRGGKYPLHYHAEQQPSPDSRIVLSTQKDQFGMPRVAVDLRFTTLDVDSVIRSHQILDQGLQSSRLGHLQYMCAPEQLQSKVMDQASDGFHQAGTTRMGENPQNSVVDKNLNVHGVSNLFVASTSVFPTAGQANSTFLGAALAVRLAHHLKTGSSASLQ